MCRKCEPILGFKTKKHTEADCPLAQAAYCPLCGISGHFTKDCERKPKMLSESDLPLPTVETPMAKDTYLLSDSPEAHVEYLKLYDIEPSSRKDKNKTLVTTHLKSRGKIVVVWPTKSTTPAA
jgi:hypothetical protein